MQSIAPAMIHTYFCIVSPPFRTPTRRGAGRNSAAPANLAFPCCASPIRKGRGTEAPRPEAGICISSSRARDPLFEVLLDLLYQFLHLQSKTACIPQAVSFIYYPFDARQPTSSLTSRWNRSRFSLVTGMPFLSSVWALLSVPQRLHPAALLILRMSSGFL